MITLTALEKSFGQNHVLRGVTLQVPKGSSMVIIGGSGTGKSVLLKCILGLVTPEDWAWSPQYVCASWQATVYERLRMENHKCQPADARLGPLKCCFRAL